MQFVYMILAISRIPSHGFCSCSIKSYVGNKDMFLLENEARIEELEVWAKTYL